MYWLICCSLVAKSCPILSDPLDCSTPGFPVCPSPSPGACTNSCQLSWWCHPTILSSVTRFSFCVQSLPDSVQFSFSVVSNSVWPHGLQHARHPCPSPTPRVYSNSCPLSQWCHPAISSSVTRFSICLQSFPASGSFQMSQLFASGGQSIGVSASISVLPVNIQDWFPLGWTSWISLQSKGLSSSKSSILQCSAFFIVQLSHPYVTTGKTITLTGWTFVGKVMSLHFDMLSRLVITFLPRSKHLLISLLTICSDFRAPPNIVCHCFHCFPIYLPWNDGTRCHESLFSECWALSQLFHSPLSLSSRSSLVLHFLPKVWYHPHIWGYWYFSQQSRFQLVLHPAQHFTWCTLHAN